MDSPVIQEFDMVLRVGGGYEKTLIIRSKQILDGYGDITDEIRGHRLPNSLLVHIAESL